MIYNRSGRILFISSCSQWHLLQNPHFIYANYVVFCFYKSCKA